MTSDKIPIYTPTAMVGVFLYIVITERRITMRAQPYGFFSPTRSNASVSTTEKPCSCPPPKKPRTELPGEYAAYWYVGYLPEAPEQEEEVDIYVKSRPQRLYPIVSKYVETEITGAEVSAGDVPMHLVYIAPVRAGNIRIFVDDVPITITRTEINVEEESQCYFSEATFVGEHHIRVEAAP